MVRSLILRIRYFFCVLCKSTTYHLIFAIVKDWSSCRRVFSCADLESRVHSLHALGDTSETQHADYKHRKTLSFPHRYSTTVEPKFLRDLQILKGKKRTPLNLRATLPTPADWFPIACLSCRLFSLSLIRWTVVFDFMLVLFSPAFFTKVFGACLAFLWNVQGKKKGRQQKCKRNVHYSIIGLGHSCKACVRLITWGDFRQVYRGVASFSTSCRPGWLSLPHILKIARMISTHWLQRHFELFSFLAHPSNA